MLALPFLPVGPRVSGLDSMSTPVRETAYPDPGAAAPLPAGSLFRLDGDQRGKVIHSRRGVVWVTQAGDAHDHVLRPGDVFAVSRPGRVIIQVLEAAAFEII